VGLDCPRSGPGQVRGIFSGPGPGPPSPVRSLAGPGPGPHWTGSTRFGPGPDSDLMLVLDANIFHHFFFFFDIRTKDKLAL
jgi:hypothetical protein